ncbi:MAG: HD domain-containing protein [Gemmatimonadetes bacterium]|nr:HD domain-containing protein [Gemmatimonadota bacterium]
MDIIRDPLWNNIRVDARALRLVDTPTFQRLRHVRQLGWAYLVYPGATHARFEHALGAYHLAGVALQRLEEDGSIAGIDATERTIARLAALLHDVGHYPFSHALEEIGAPHHEEVARPLVTEGAIASILREVAPDAPERVLDLIRGRSTSPLQGLISGSLDLDKIEYLKRDGLMCGVPYGEIDVDRLIHALTVAVDPVAGRPVVAIREKGLSALESLLFAKYQMYRNVYWHHAVRSATAMYKRLVEHAIRDGAVTVHALAGYADESLLHTLEQRHPSPLLTRLRTRNLFKRAFECPAAELPPEVVDAASSREQLSKAEARLAATSGLGPEDVLVDFPEKTQMLGLDMPVVRRDGSVQRLTTEGLSGSINLPVLADALYQSARWLRVFTARPVTLSREAVLSAVASA